MSNLRTQEPLVFENMIDIRNRLTEIFEQGGLEEVKKYVSEEFTAQRAIKIEKDTFYIFDVQLRRLDNGNPGDIILDFANNPTPENSRPLVTVNVVDIEPNLQLIIRKRL